MLLKHFSFVLEIAIWQYSKFLAYPKANKISDEKNLGTV